MRNSNIVLLNLIITAIFLFSCSVDTGSKTQSDSDVLSQDQSENYSDNDKIDEVVDAAADDSAEVKTDKDVIDLNDEDRAEVPDDVIDETDEYPNDEDAYQPDETQVEIDEVSNDNEDETPDEDIDLLDPWTDYSAMLIGTEEDELGIAFGMDGDGNIYLTGYTEGDLDDQTNAGGQDIFLIKFDDKGNKLWTKLYGTVSDDAGRSVQIDSAGNIYIAGYTNGNLSGDGNLGEYDVYLMKLDENGDMIWVEQFGTENPDLGMKLVFDNLENLYVSGNINARESEDFILGAQEVFLAKYDKNGSRIWIERWGTEGYNSSNYTKYYNGYLYVPGGTTENLGGNGFAGGNYDSFVTKVSPSGNISWLRQWGGIGSESVFDIEWDTQSNIYLCGNSTDGVADPEMDDLGVYFAKLDSDGYLQFEKVWNSDSWEGGSSILSDGNSGFYISGYSGGNFNGYQNAGHTDFFLMKVDASGNHIWTKLVGSSGMDVVIPSIIDNYGNIYVSGWTDGDLGGIENSGGTDIFISSEVSVGGSTFVNGFEEIELFDNCSRSHVKTLFNCIFNICFRNF